MYVHVCVVAQSIRVHESEIHQRGNAPVLMFITQSVDISIRDDILHLTSTLQRISSHLIVAKIFYPSKCLNETYLFMY